MINELEYKEILPYREMILSFRKDGNYKGDALHLANRLRQKYGCGPPINFSCNGCKIEAMNDLYHLMVEYEKQNNL